MHADFTLNRNTNRDKILSYPIIPVKTMPLGANYSVYCLECASAPILYSTFCSAHVHYIAIIV